jgi:hypothetical protein
LVKFGQFRRYFGQKFRWQSEDFEEKMSILVRFLAIWPLSGQILKTKVATNLVRKSLKMVEKRLKTAIFEGFWAIFG